MSVAYTTFLRSLAAEVSIPYLWYTGGGNAFSGIEVTMGTKILSLWFKMCYHYDFECALKFKRK